MELICSILTVFFEQTELDPAVTTELEIVRSIVRCEWWVHLDASAAWFASVRYSAEEWIVTQYDYIDLERSYLYEVHL